MQAEGVTATSLPPVLFQSSLRHAHQSAAAISAKETAQFLVQHVFWLHGLPMALVSDRCPLFSSAFWGEFCKLTGTTSSLSSRFHSQSNDQTEKKNQDMEVALRCMASRDPTAWSSLLVWVKYAYNSLISSATGLSPFQSVYGYQPPLFPALNSDVSCPSALAYIRQWKQMWTQARTTLLRSIGRYATQANCRDLPLQVESRKLAWGLWVLFPSRGSSVRQRWGPSPSSPASSTAHWRWSGICCSAPDSLSLMREGTAILGRLGGVWSRRLVLGSSAAYSGPSADPGLPSMVSRQAFSMQQQETPTPRALGTGIAWGDWGGAWGHGEWGGARARRCGALQVT